MHWSDHETDSLSAADIDFLDSIPTPSLDDLLAPDCSAVEAATHAGSPARGVVPPPAFLKESNATPPTFLEDSSSPTPVFLEESKGESSVTTSALSLAG